MSVAHSTSDRNELRLHEALSREFLLHHRVCPKEIAPDGSLVVAVGPRPLEEALQDLRGLYGREVSTSEVSQSELEQLIERLATASERQFDEVAISTVEDDADLRDLANQPPVVRYVNMLVREAFDAAASDIHIEAAPGGVVVRFRVDGTLVPAPTPPAQLHYAVVSRIKLLAELDIAEHRKPQDGRIRVRLESRDLDLRVSSVPTIHGESIVLRLLDRGGRPVELHELGISPEVLRHMEALASRPHGMLLVTGPTGSGKTTTLYACLQRRDTRAEKIVTIEDPIEYQLPNVTQVPVHRQSGVTFASALRSILRQDPDVIMLGEMRDPETAEIAVQSAMTGHLVFSTLHTNDAISAIPRLIDLGVPPYLVGATLEAVLAQRLVRKICDHCRTTYSPAPEHVAALSGKPSGRRKLERGAGCRACGGTGFRGRVGIFELLLIGDAEKDAIARGGLRTELRDLAQTRGMTSIRQDGWLKVEMGLTTAEEVLRVAQA
jgi:type II secretory ATPase GspE/PulE/Tfp pilus assembly ATPase PilB-like protein